MKKVLIITYYWPPSGGPGVQRVLKLAKYLPQFGWEPIILTVEDGEYPSTDTSLQDQDVKTIKVYKTKTVEFFSLFKKLSGQKSDTDIDTFILDNKSPSIVQKLFGWIRINFFLPDGRVGWKKFAVKKGLDIIAKEKIDLILTSSPPHTVQLIGRALQSRTGTKWIADFRDPWLDAFWEKDIYRNPISDSIAKRQEANTVKAADRIIMTTKGFKSLFEKKFGLTGIHVVTNGYDEADFSGIERQKSSQFKIVYTGSIAHSQNPIQFWQSIASLDAELLKKLKVSLFGKIDPSVAATIKKNDLEAVVDYRGYINHNQVIQELVNANLLLLLLPEGRSDIIPGKLFEYMGSGNEILCIGKTGDATEIIDKENFGKSFGYEDDLTKYLTEKIRDWQQGNIGFTRNAPSLYSRKSQAKEFATIFNDLCP